MWACVWCIWVYVWCMGLCMVYRSMCGVWACMWKVSGVLMALYLIPLRHGLSLNLQFMFFFSSWTGSQQAPDTYSLISAHPGTGVKGVLATKML